MMKETFVNETKGYRFGESDWYEAGTDDRGKLFLALQEEYGRCVSEVYIDREGKPPLAVGWVFEKRMKYEDARGNDPERDYCTRQVWVTVAERVEVEPRKVTVHYFE